MKPALSSKTRICRCIQEHPPLSSVTTRVTDIDVSVLSCDKGRSMNRNRRTNYHVCLVCEIPQVPTIWVKNDRCVRNPVPIAQIIDRAPVVTIRNNQQKLKSDGALQLKDDICVDCSAIRDVVSIENNDFGAVFP